MNFKAGVKWNGIRGPILRALAEIEPIMEATGEFTVTSALDGTHMKGSFHPKGLAVDLRSHHIPPEKRAHVMSEIERVLGEDYDVFLEGEGTPGEHIHVEVSDDWLAAHGDPRIVA